MKKAFPILALFIASTILFIVSTLSYAQSVVTRDAKITWDQDATTLVEAQKYFYKYYLDNSNVGMVLVRVNCIGTVSPYQCQVAIPAFTYNTHTLSLTANSSLGESPKSPIVTFTFALNSDSPKPPIGPKNLIIKQG
jgi:hypothetical protein